MKTISVFGIGGHAAVVAEACEASGWKVGRFFVEKGFESSSPKRSAEATEVTRRDQLDPKETNISSFVVGIGNNESRLWWCEKLHSEGFELPVIIHPRAWVSPSAILAEGVFVGAGAVVQAGAKIGRACLINSNATVEHHCIVEMGSHIGPGAILAGLVHVGEAAMVGAGAVIKDRVRIGKAAVVGAGAAVIQNVSEGDTVGGVPAKPIH